MAKRSAAKKAATRKTAARPKKSVAAGRKKTAVKATRTKAAARPVRKAVAKKVAKKATKTATKKATKKRVAKAAPTAPLFLPVRGAEVRNIGHVQLEVGRAGAARVKRMIYPPGFHWKEDMKPVTGSELCMHAHVGFLAHGEIHIEYADGCIVEFKAPQVVAIEPGHDGWVVGNEPVVLIEFDFERETAEKLGMGKPHSHSQA